MARSYYRNDASGIEVGGTTEVENQWRIVTVKQSCRIARVASDDNLDLIIISPDVFRLSPSYGIANIGEQMGEDYARAWDTLFSPTFMAGLLVAVFLASCLGGLLGQKMLRKHFVRAGIA